MINPEQVMRKCKKCGEVKPLEAYFKKKDCKDGRVSTCRECSRWSNKKYYEANKEKCIKRVTEYHKKNRDKSRLAAKKFRERHLDKVKENERIYLLNNPEKRFLTEERQSAKKFISKQYGIDKKDIPEELIQYKLFQYKLYRQIKMKKNESIKS